MSLFTSCHLCLSHLAASSSNAFLFFNLAFSAPPDLFLPSILPDAYRWGRADPDMCSLRKLFGKDGLWTQPTLFGRGELPRMVQPVSVCVSVSLSLCVCVCVCVCLSLFLRSEEH